MPWNTCIKEHIKKIEKDTGKISSIIKMSNIRLRVTEQIVLDDETASIIAMDYYEVIKELLTALMLCDGMKSDNHECLISHFRHRYPDKEYEAKTIHQLKNVRNRISYDGASVDRSYIEINKFEFRHIIEMLQKLIKI